MKTRLSRKGIDLGELQQGGIFGMMDALARETCRISEDELDLLCEVATPEQIELVTAEALTFTQKRELLQFLEEKIYNQA